MEAATGIAGFPVAVERACRLLGRQRARAEVPDTAAVQLEAHAAELVQQFAVGQLRRTRPQRPVVSLQFAAQRLVLRRLLLAETVEVTHDILS